MSEPRHSTELDPVVRAFPDTSLADAAHEVIGEALTALVDAGVELDAARTVVRAAVAAIIEDYEQCSNTSAARRARTPAGRHHRRTT